ncbi:hypothetical protein [Vibrio natriegens]|uniref:hypothetical protein n=1 Tax=Vibrio natriegens TaxID=691 RepID=UPI0012D7DB80|nr:hypothetical protein [Vibrio natriegens]MDX6028968.1 hypothetical protein [Vibrio natriegens NBRC 15636 = ATCC 14048 = DSM 759]UUI14320.1 hypothetical protein NP431_16900 [Vibrio natriegens]WRS50872.1 hypothetical protein VER99_15195 [Vibrio natriegens NBRC 15636 = ATCC 14048 = DSM 759]
MMTFIYLYGKEHRYSPEVTSMNISFYVVSHEAFLVCFINALITQKPVIQSGFYQHWNLVLACQ